MRGNFFNDIINPIYDIFTLHHQEIREGVLPGSSILDFPQRPQYQTGYIINNILATTRPNEAYDGNEPALISMSSLQPINSIENFLYHQDIMAKVKAPLRDANPLTVLENNTCTYRLEDYHGPVPIAAKRSEDQLRCYCMFVNEVRDIHATNVYFSREMCKINSYTYNPELLFFNVFNYNMIYQCIQKTMELYEVVKPFVDLSQSDLTKFLYNSPLRNNLVTRNAVYDMGKHLDIMSYVLDIQGKKTINVYNMYNFTVASSILLQGLFDAALNISFNITQGTENDFNIIMEKLPPVCSINPEKMRHLSEHLLLDLTKLQEINVKLSGSRYEGFYNKDWLTSIQSKSNEKVVKYLYRVFNQ